MLLLRSRGAGAVAKYCDEYVCLSVREDISGTTCAIFTIFMRVAYVRGSVVLRHIDDRPHRLSAGNGVTGVQCEVQCVTPAKCNLRIDCLVHYCSTKRVIVINCNRKFEPCLYTPAAEHHHTLADHTHFPLR